MEPEVLYEIGPNDCATSVISLKANTRLLRDVSESWNSFIEFTSETTCRITCDDEEFELTLTEAMPMDAYELSEERLNHAGEISTRLQVTNSKSGVTIGESGSSSTAVEKEFPTVSGKREISLVESAAVDCPPEKPIKRKRVVTDAKERKETPSASIHSPNATSKSPNAVVLTTPVLCLPDVPVEVCASDITSSLFAGLSVAAVYICAAGTEEEGGREESAPVAAVGVYVEFAYLSGAELGVQRDGEQLLYRTPIGSGGSSSSSSSSAIKFTRQSMAPYIDPVGPELAMWVRHAGLRVSSLPELPPLMVGTSSTKSSASSSAARTPNLGARSSFREHIDSAVAMWSELGLGATVESEENNPTSAVLLDPERLNQEWQLVVSQMMLPAGTVEAYNADGSGKVRIAKDTADLFTNPAVEDVLLSTQFWSSPAPGWVQAGPAPDAQHEEGLYYCDKDMQRSRYRPLRMRAEQKLKSLAEDWSVLLAAVVAGTSDGDEAVGRHYLSDLLLRQLQLYKILLKVAWGVSSTFCVFTKQ